MQKYKKILFVVSEDWYFITHRFDLAKVAIEKGYKIALLSNFSTYRKKIEKEGIQTFDWGISRKNFNFIYEIKSLFKLYLTIKQFNPEIVYAVSLKTSVLTSIITYFLNIKKTIYAISGFGYFFTSKKITAQFIKFLLLIVMRILKSNKSKIIVQNPEDKKILLNYNISKKENIILIKGVGVDLKKFSPKKNDNKVIKVFLGTRLLKSKGIQTYLDFATYFHKNKLNTQFYLAGRVDRFNPDQFPLNNILKYDKMKVINWLGYKEKIHEILRGVDILLFPSQYGEGVPKILLEAAGCGIPIIAYNIPGCKEVVKNNVNGFVAPAGNQELLKKYLLELSQNKKLRLSMGKQSRLIAEKFFDSNKTIEKTIRLWG